MELIIIGVVIVGIIGLLFANSRKKEMPFGISGGTLRLQAPLAGTLKMRNDRQGLGHYGAPRGNRRHSGLDFEAKPGQAVLAPISGKIRRIQVYASDPRWRGLAIKNGNLEVKLFYMQPLANLPVSVERGQVVGNMQDRAATSPGMINHLHVEVWVDGKHVNPASFFTFNR